MIKRVSRLLNHRPGHVEKAYYCVNENGQPLDKRNADIKEKLERRLSEGEAIQVFEIVMQYEDAPHAIG